MEAEIQDADLVVEGGRVAQARGCGALSLENLHAGSVAGAEDQAAREAEDWLN